MIGKLKKSTNQKCPYCGSVLQIRTKSEKAIQEGFPCLIDKEFLVCSNFLCDYEIKLEQRRRRKQEDI